MKILYRLILISFIIICASINNIKAQERARTQFQEYSTGPGSFIQGIPVPKSPTKGTIYLYEDYSPGILITKKNEKISDIKLRYNVRDQKIEMKNNELDIQLNGKLIDSFQINNDHQFINVFSIPVEKKHGLDGFLQIMAKDEGQMLLKRWFINMKKATYNIALSTGTKYDEALLKNEMYIVYDQRLIPFNGKSKEIKNNFPHISNELLEFVKESKIKFKSDEDYITFFNYLASLN